MQTEKIDLDLHDLPNPENVNLEATMKLLQMENENLRSTVKSLKQHMLKMMKDQKSMRAKIESLETELMAAKSKIEGSPELRRRTIAPGSVALSSTGFAINGTHHAAGANASAPVGTYLAVGAGASAPQGASISADRIFSPGGKQRAVSVHSKPLPIPPTNGNAKNAPAKLGNARLDITSAQSTPRNAALHVSSPRNEEEYLLPLFPPPPPYFYHTFFLILSSLSQLALFCDSSAPCLYKAKVIFRAHPESIYSSRKSGYDLASRNCRSSDWFRQFAEELAGSESVRNLRRVPGRRIVPRAHCQPGPLAPHAQPLAAHPCGIRSRGRKNAEFPHASH